MPNRSQLTFLVEMARIDAPHKIGIDVFAVAISVVMKCGLDLEAEFFIKGNTTWVIGEDFQLNPVQIQPVVGQIAHGGHKRTANAYFLVILVNLYAHIRPMSAA